MPKLWQGVAIAQTRASRHALLVVVKGPLMFRHHSGTYGAPQALSESPGQGFLGNPKSVFDCALCIFFCVKPTFLLFWSRETELAVLVFSHNIGRVETRRIFSKVTSKLFRRWRISNAFNLVLWGLSRSGGRTGFPNTLNIWRVAASGVPLGWNRVLRLPVCAWADKGRLVFVARS